MAIIAWKVSASPTVRISILLSLVLYTWAIEKT